MSDDDQDLGEDPGAHRGGYSEDLEDVEEIESEAFPDDGFRTVGGPRRAAEEEKTGRAMLLSG